MKKARKKKRHRNRTVAPKRSWLRFGVVAFALVGSALAVALTWPQASIGLAAVAIYPSQLKSDFTKAVREVHDLETRQRTLRSQLVSDRELEGQLSLAQLDTTSGHFSMAKKDLATLQQAINNWNLELSGGSNNTVGANVSVQPGTYLPILLYHYPPPNFSQQMDHLEQAGYTVINMDQAISGLQGGGLPLKPVVITCEDGFDLQMQAFDILKKHNMPATFYIIDGGAASQWCIGAGRRYGDPLQPASGCGDAYLTWQQVRQLDQSGLITIAAHTVNHRNLASLSAADQEYEIITGKHLLEAKLGHPVRHFAYPYGAFNNVTLKIVQKAGFTSAVTTIPGSLQPANSAFQLLRVRDALQLP
jgi:peptidoglycan/xylan/chitin deacetylase (PgdA/CDA1 family)